MILTKAHELRTNLLTDEPYFEFGRPIFQNLDAQKRRSSIREMSIRLKRDSNVGLTEDEELFFTKLKNPEPPKEVQIVDPEAVK